MAILTSNRSLLQGKQGLLKRYWAVEAAQQRFKRLSSTVLCPLRWQKCVGQHPNCPYETSNLPEMELSNASLRLRLTFVFPFIQQP